MKNGEKKNKLMPVKSEEGFAILEALVFLMAFAVLTVYMMDFFSAIHTGVVNSIAARTYLFETLQHRSNIRYLRDEDDKPDNRNKRLDFASDHERFHAVTDEDWDTNDNSNIRPSGRRLTYAADDNNVLHSTSVIYIKTGYGICLDSQCRGD